MFLTIYYDIMSPEVNLWGAIFKLLLSMILGGAVGFERSRRGQFAGMRTFALIAMGATLAMLISIYIPQAYMGLKNGDPGRIAAQVVSGIGFLGAGAIIQMKGSVRGLTTAAGIWMVACIGLAVGAGMYLIAVIATLFIIYVLANIDRYEHIANFQWESKVICVKTNGIVYDLKPAADVLKKFDIKSQGEYLKCDYETNTTIINFIVLTKDSVKTPLLFKKFHETFENILSITLTSEPKF